MAFSKISGKTGLPMLSVPIEPVVLINSELEVVRLVLMSFAVGLLLLTLVADDWANAADAVTAIAAIDMKNTRVINTTPLERTALTFDAVDFERADNTPFLGQMKCQ